MISPAFLLLALALASIVVGCVIYYLNAMTAFYAEKMVREAADVVYKERALAHSFSPKDGGTGDFPKKW